MKQLLVQSIALLALAGLSMPLVASPIFSSSVSVNESDVLGPTTALGGDGNSYYYFYQEGDGWKIDLDETGLAEVRAVDVKLRVIYNDITPPGQESPLHPGEMLWSVSLNNIEIGGWSWGYGDGGKSGPKKSPFGSEVNLSLNFSDFAVTAKSGSAPEYQLKMLVDNPFQSGAGSLAFEPQSVTLRQYPVPVPEPGVFLLLLSGLGLVAYFGYRSRRPTAAWRRGLPRVT